MKKLLIFLLMGLGFMIFNSISFADSHNHTINEEGYHECKQDLDCPSSQYRCQALQGIGTAYPNNIKPAASRITRGICKLKDGSQCRVDSQCFGQLRCHANVCTDPIGCSCNGAYDTSCPTDFECVQTCGLSGPYRKDLVEQPAQYFCKLKGYVLECPE